MLIEDLTKAFGGSKDIKPKKRNFPGSIEIRSKAPIIKEPDKVQPKKNLKPTILPPVIGIPPRFQKKADPAPFKPIPPPQVVSPGQAAIDAPSALQPLQQQPGVGQATSPQEVPNPNIENPGQGIPVEPGQLPQPVPQTPPVPEIPSVPVQDPVEIPLPVPKPDTVIPVVPEKPKPAIVPPFKVPVPKIDPLKQPPEQKPVAPPIERPTTEPTPVFPDIQPYIPQQEPEVPDQTPEKPEEIPVIPPKPLVEPERKKEEPEEQQPEKPEEIKPAAIQNSRIIYPQAAIPQTAEEEKKYTDRVATEAIKTFMIVPGSDKSLDKIAKELNIKPADLKDYNPNYKQGNPILVPDKIVQKTTNITSITSGQRLENKSYEELQSRLQDKKTTKIEKEKIKKILNNVIRIPKEVMQKVVGGNPQSYTSFYNIINNSTRLDIDNYLKSASSADYFNTSGAADNKKYTPKIQNDVIADTYDKDSLLHKSLKDSKAKIYPYPQQDKIETNVLKNLKTDLGIEAGDMAKRLGKAALNSPVFLAYGLAVDLLNPPELNAKQDLEVRNIQLNDLIANLNDKPSKNLEENTKKQEQVIEFFLKDKWKSNALEEKIDPAIPIIKNTIDDEGKIIDSVAIKGENIDQLNPEHLATGPYIAKDIDKLIENTADYRNELNVQIQAILSSNQANKEQKYLEISNKIKIYDKKIQMLQEVKNELPPTRGIALRNFLTNQLKLERLRIPTDQEKQEDVDIKPVIIDFKIANDLDQAIKNKDNESILDSIDSRNNAIIEQAPEATSDMFHVILPADIGNQLYETTKIELDELYTKFYNTKLKPNTEALQATYKKLIQKLQYRFQSLGAYVTGNKGNTGIQAQLKDLQPDILTSADTPAGVQFNDNGKKYIELLSNKYGLPSVKPLLSIYANESSSGKFLKGDFNQGTKQYDSVGGLHVNIRGGFAQYKQDLNPAMSWQDFKDNYILSTEVGVWYYNKLLKQTRIEKNQNNWPDDKITFYSKDGKLVEVLKDLQGVPIEFIYAAIRYNGGPGKIDKNNGFVTIPLNKNEITSYSNILGYAKKFIDNY